MLVYTYRDHVIPIAHIWECHCNILCRYGKWRIVNQLVLLKVLYFKTSCNVQYSIIGVGHVGTVYGLAIIETPGNMRLVSASYDKTLRVCIGVVLGDICILYMWNRFGVWRR